METIVERCCGLDVHQATVVACLLVGPPGKKTHKEVRTFRTVTRELIELRDWLLSKQCTHVAMESTGVYWKPVYAILEDDFEMILGNAQHIRNVPGRKTDVKDSEWIANLVRHGLIAKSFVPPKPIRDLRELLRYRRKLIESRSTERNRLLKVLETANIKLSSMVSDAFGACGRRMLAALAQGAASPQEMAQFAKGRMRRKIPDLELALEGRLEEHHRFLLSLQLRRLDQADSDLAELDRRIDEKMVPYQAQREALAAIPGVERVVAAVIVAELGTDMTVFHSAQHLAAWAGLCPGNYESAGKRQSGNVRKGNVHLRTMLVEAAQSASTAKGSYLKDKFFRLQARRGRKRAIIAIAHKILIAAYQILCGNPYRDLGDAYLDRLSRHRVTNQLVRRLERMGYDVQLVAADAAAAAAAAPS